MTELFNENMQLVGRTFGLTDAHFWVMRKMIVDLSTKPGSQGLSTHGPVLYDYVPEIDGIRISLEKYYALYNAQRADGTLDVAPASDEGALEPSSVLSEQQ